MRSMKDAESPACQGMARMVVDCFVDILRENLVASSTQTAHRPEETRPEEEIRKQNQKKVNKNKHASGSR